MLSAAATAYSCHGPQMSAHLTFSALQLREAKWRPVRWETPAVVGIGVGEAGFRVNRETIVGGGCWGPQQR